ncbi:phosphotransferase [Mesosutterella sp. AGMB02718]|uniref:Phosphotransferase n=1 Tax=Mesosutterella faecium TaxID=2925194 RepID=A0ABT7IKR6_9BURK|nr:phosphotransferase [Mesosutterella sp. AGMB02718]MDL2058958.1 phosphotransferase [Mesosutterella sp. AGMB02718]
MPEDIKTADERLGLLKGWLSGHAQRYSLRLETIAPASSDAGFRRYFRIASGTQPQSYIVMDAPPEKEPIAPFIRMDAVCVRAGLNVPHIYEADPRQGFMLLSDLGRETCLDRLLKDRGCAPGLFDAATTALTALQTVSEPGIVPEYSEEKLRGELSLFPEWYVRRHRGSDFDETEEKIWQGVCDRLVSSMLSEGRVIVHRDFMPRNLMVSDPMPGVLDFQDALYGPVSYDIASLMRDAFISWDESFTLDVSIRYWEKARRAGLPVPRDFRQFWQQIEWSGLQRHLKVLGIFARLNYRDHKPRYLKDTPRFVAYVRHVAGRYGQLRPLLTIFDRLEGPSGSEQWTY